MRRESDIMAPAEQYLFKFPLTNDGVNQGNLPESQYIGRLRNYGSTSNTANFNDNLVFGTTYGEMAHIHTGNADKLVSLIDSSFDAATWLNNNDWELNLDYYFSNYSGYQQVLEFYRNPNYTSGSNYSVGFDGRYTSSLWLILWYDGTTDGVRLWDDSSPLIYVTNGWVRMNIVKESGAYTTTYTRLSDNNVINSKTGLFPQLATGRSARYITVFGTYMEGGNLNTRYVAGASKNFYLKKL